MTSQYTRDQLKLCVAKMCITIGWHSSMTTPIEILTDILSNYLHQLGRSTNEYANGFGMTDPNLDHLGLTFRDFHINLSELQEYVKNVDCAESGTAIPKYPIPKEDHLNFLKPGSKEVVTRQVHIHEHLPPMHPLLEAAQMPTESNSNNDTTEEIDVVENTSPVFKRPQEISQGDSFKRPRLLLEDEGRPTREISSVMMTTSGFLSPAREGKLPEARTPMPALEPIILPPALPAEQPEVPVTKKLPKTTKKIEKKKERIGKELFKPLDDPGQKVPKKLGTPSKDNSKSKTKYQVPPQMSSAPNFPIMGDLNISLIPNKMAMNPPQKINKALAAARLKTEKLNTTITPIPTKPVIAPPIPIIKPEPNVDKLFTEPDKRKINILKKISVKNEKMAKVKDDIKQESRESSPDLVIDESINEATNKVHHLSSDITIELIDSIPLVKDKTERLYFYDDSPPGTPSTPKTPEMISQSPPLNKVEKRKRKDKSKIKKIQKISSPARLDTDIIDMEMERPKTPEAHVVIKPEKPEISASTLPFPFFPSFAGPGLIPPPLGNPLFSHLSIPPLGIPSFGHPPYIPPVHPNLPMNFMQSIKHEEPPQKSPSADKPAPAPAMSATVTDDPPTPKGDKKNKEHKKEKKDKLKKKNKKDKVKNKAEKKKLKEDKKDKIKKEKREKRKEKDTLRDNDSIVPKLTLKLGSPHPDSPETRKFGKMQDCALHKNIKPIVKKEEEPVEIKEVKREMSPELAKISALVTGQPKPKTTTNHVPPPTKEELAKEEVVIHTQTTARTGPGPGRPRIHPIKPKPTKLNKQQQHPMVKDAVGNTVWYCPACGKQDDGSPMIGCDDCDAWYHWVCVGIQIPPDENENWYCRICLSKKEEVLQMDKKKKRKKREKKEH
ncbi:transcription initiation factor TFIID subunit 3 isoform X3 [Photinus pyralis]|uniref:transcription initiation factor TFIID subunit 3 isoform X3 n=1 Tax=Photinus pyralis TaxID=7054 RepID=UPI0012674D2B|nr:transcription initiation factor TFIID subunit 3 isoform X3 [Photinus pyralis]